MKNHTKECFTCPICHEKFSQKKNLTRHLVKHSTKMPKLSCNECNFTTFRKDKLSAHMHIKHRHTQEERSSKQTSHGEPKQKKDSSEAEIEAMEMKESAEESKPECNRKDEKVPKDTSEKLGDYPRLKRNWESRFNFEAGKDLHDWVRNVGQSIFTNPNGSDSAGVEKEGSVFDGLLGLLSGSPPPPEFTSFSTGRGDSTLKQDKIFTTPNGDFVNPPNVTVTLSSPIALPFTYARSPYLTLLSPSDIEAVLCEAASDVQQ